MTVTVSEVYANEMAVYLTLLLKRENPFLNWRRQNWIRITRCADNVAAGL